MNDADSKKLEEIDAKIDECGANRKDQHWLISKVKEQDREIERWIDRLHIVAHYAHNYKDRAEKAEARVKELDKYLRQSEHHNDLLAKEIRRLLAEKEKV